MRIAIASGKGGTGKTTVAGNLGAFLNMKGKEVTLVDCDVEEPNLHYFFNPNWSRVETQTVPVPKIDESKCLGESCQMCVQECRFKSLIWMVRSILVFPELCHGCGLCEYICPADAILSSSREIGTLRQGMVQGMNFCGGVLRIGEAMAPPLIKRVLQAAPGAEVQVVDAPPGSSCPVIESLKGADLVLLVAEPTPFGLHDLQIAVELMRSLHLTFGVVVNRHGMGDDRTEKYLEQEGIDILAKLPYSREAAQKCSKGLLLVETMDEFYNIYSKLWENLIKLQNEAGREARMIAS